MSARRIEQADIMLVAPAGVLTQEQRVRLAGQAGVPARTPLGIIVLIVLILLIVVALKC